MPRDQRAHRTGFVENATGIRIVRQELDRAVSFRKRPGREILAMTIDRVAKLVAIHVCFVP